MNACEVCGSTLDDLRQTGLLGCPACYRCFHEELKPVLARFHGDDAHVGLMHRAADQQQLHRRDLARTRALLDQAVVREKFEEAAQLRDRIKELEGHGPEGDS